MKSIKIISGYQGCELGNEMTKFSVNKGIVHVQWDKIVFNFICILMGSDLVVTNLGGFKG